VHTTSVVEVVACSICRAVLCALFWKAALLNTYRILYAGIDMLSAMRFDIAPATELQTVTRCMIQHFMAAMAAASLAIGCCTHKGL
jgi:hypothetical protein